MASATAKSSSAGSVLAIPFPSGFSVARPAAGANLSTQLSLPQTEEAATHTKIVLPGVDERVAPVTRRASSLDAGKRKM